MAWDLGDTVTLAVDVLDDAGDPAVPSSVVLTIELPDGTTATPTPSNPSAGRYQVAYVPTQVGRHVARWVSTEPATAFVDIFDVQPASPAYVISLDDAKAHLGITSTSHDEELRDHIAAATGALELYLRERVVRRTEVQTIELCRPTRTVPLDWHPVIALVSVTSLDGATEWDVADMTVSAEGILRVRSGPALSGPVVITYRTGRAVISPAYTRAAKQILEQLYGPQRSPGAGPPGQPGGEDDLQADAYAVVISPTVRELLGDSGPLVG